MSRCVFVKTSCLHDGYFCGMEDSPAMMQILSCLHIPRTDALLARRRIRGAPTKLTEAELARYRSTVYGMAAAVGRVPRMSFGRDRYAMAASAAQVRTGVRAGFVLGFRSWSG